MAFIASSTNELDSSGNIINPAKEDGNLLAAKNDLDTLAATASGGNLNVNVTNASVTTTTAPNFATRSDTFTTTGNGITVSKATAPVSRFSVSVKGTGAAATIWDVRLEGSLDNTNFTQILQHTTTTGDGVALYIGSLTAPSLYFRSRCAGLTLGSATNIVVTILGL